MKSNVSPAGWLGGVLDIMAGCGATTNLARDPDDPYDPADDLPWTIAEVIE